MLGNTFKQHKGALTGRGSSQKCILSRQLITSPGQLSPGPKICSSPGSFSCSSSCVVCFPLQSNSKEDLTETRALMRAVQSFDPEVATGLQENRRFRWRAGGVVNAVSWGSHGLVQAQAKASGNAASCIFLRWRAILSLAGKCGSGEPFVVPWAAHSPPPPLFAIDPLPRWRPPRNRRGCWAAPWEWWGAIQKMVWVINCPGNPGFERWHSSFKNE